jgi:hypothetical protein
VTIKKFSFVATNTENVYNFHSLAPMALCRFLFPIFNKIKFFAPPERQLFHLKNKRIELCVDFSLRNCKTSKKMKIDKISKLIPLDEIQYKIKIELKNNEKIILVKFHLNEFQSRSCER